MNTNEMTMRQLCQQKAAKLWQQFTPNEKGLVRIGMFPCKPMMDADKEGYDSRLLAVAIMDEANKDGGMIA